MGKPLKNHHACPWCGSSDAATTYQGDDGSTYIKCYSCGKSGNSAQKEKFEKMEEKTTKLLEGETPEAHRGISSANFSHYHVIKAKDDDAICFPYYTYDGFLCAQKIRKEDVKGLWLKESQEDFKKRALFGSNLRKTTDRSVVITEGEYDAIAAHQLLGGSALCVSITNGAQGGCSEKDIEWLSSFERVYICFDNDEPGRKAAEKLSTILGPKTGYIMTVKGYKDANELLEKEPTKAYKIFHEAYQNATPYKPESIVLGSETYNEFIEDSKEQSLDFPWESLQRVVPGLCLGRLYVISAGSGVGKSILNKSLGYHIWRNHQTNNIGCLFLEESLKDTVTGFVGIHIGKNLFVHRDYPKEGKTKAWKEIFATTPQRFMFWNNFGSNTIESVEKTIRYMVAAFGAKFIFLDHVSMMVSSQDHGDERKTLDAIMTKLRTLCQALKICLIVVSHLRRADGTPHEEGGMTSLAQLRGSAAIGQLADVVFGLERNGQHEDPWERNLTTIRVLKNRITGETGPACRLWWNRDTSLLEEIEDDEQMAEMREEYLGKQRRVKIEEENHS